MNEHAAPRFVKLADLVACRDQPGYFVRRPGESAGAHAERLQLIDALDCNEVEKDKISRYAAALSRGERFPPILALDVAGRLILGDGYHRVAAAALLGHDGVEAVVLPVASDEAADVLMDLFYGLEFEGVPTHTALAIVAATN